MITCSVTCTFSPTPTLTLYKNSAGIARRTTSGQPISVTVLREDNGVGFYCDAVDWSGDVRSRELAFDVQCKLYV